MYRNRAWNLVSPIYRMLLTNVEQKGEIQNLKIGRE